MTTVVIVLFVGLIEGMKVRCVEQRLSFYFWKSLGRILSHLMVQVVLDRVEYAAESEF